MQLALQAQPANWNNCISCSCPPRPPLPPPSLTYSQFKVYAPVSLINLKVWSWIKQCWQFGTWWKNEIIDQWPVNYSRLTALQQQVLVMSSRSGLCNGVLNQCWSLISVSLGQTGLVFWAQPELPSRKTLWSLICPPLLLSSHALLLSWSWFCSLISSFIVLISLPALLTGCNRAPACISSLSSAPAETSYFGIPGQVTLPAIRHARQSGDGSPHTPVLNIKY